MSSDSDEQFDQEDSNPHDIYRLHHILKGVKESKRRSDKKSLLSVKDAIHLEEQKNLEARLEMTESQLAKAKENTLLLMEKLGQAQNEIEELRTLLQNERSNKEDVVRNDIYDQSPRHDEQKEIQYKEMVEQLQKLHKLCENKDHEIEKLLIKIKGLGLENQKIMYELQTAKQQKTGAQQHLKILERTMNKRVLEEQSKGVEIIEVEQLSNAVQRLIHLLKSTQQYKHFSLFAEDAKGIHFLKNIPKRLKNSNILSVPPKKVKLCSCMKLNIDQRLVWTPEETYRAMQEIKMKYESINQQCIQQILFSLNQIWLAREQCHLKRVKQSYENQIKRLKKKNQERYDEVVARKQIQRLKKEVSRAKNKSEKGMVRVQNLRVAGHYEDQLRLKQKQVKLLQEKVKLIQNQSSNYDKIIYMEGALWIIQKILKQLQNYQDNLKQFQDKFIQEINSSIPRQVNSKVNKVYKNFFQGLDELQENLYEKMLLMQESTLKKLQAKKTKENHREREKTIY